MWRVEMVGAGRVVVVVVIVVGVSQFGKISSAGGVFTNNGVGWGCIRLASSSTSGALTSTTG